MIKREKKNLQDLNGVYVYNVAEREDLDRPTARLIKEFEHMEGKTVFDCQSSCLPSLSRFSSAKYAD